MNLLELPRRPLDWKQIRNTGAPQLAPNVPAGELMVTDAESGRPVVLVVRFPDPTMLERARHAIAAYPRGQVRRQSGTTNECASFGYLAEAIAMRRYGCRSCGAATSAPWPHAVVCSLADVLYDLLRTFLPDQADTDRGIADVVDADWRLDGSPWTSGVINFDSPLPYHRDANNLPTWSAMVTWRARVTGGNLHIPDYHLVIPCRDGDVLYFPGHQLGHAVTPLHVKHDGYRHTAVFYTVAAMRHCPPITEHVAYAQTKRTDQEDHWRERQLAAGLLTEP